tara:strand:- start:201 stop:659 length:459 start_codon:yes stop_codon:yes gene_type:complete
LSEELNLPSNKEVYLSEKFLNISQEEILELAVKVVVHPTYGWLTTVLILYGCKPVETFSLIPSSDGTASVINFDKNPINNNRRKILANPFDFVEKLNICDQISQPVFYENIEDYDFEEVNNIITNWKNWFKTIKSNMELDDLRDYWLKRVTK